MIVLVTTLVVVRDIFVVLMEGLYCSQELIVFNTNNCIAQHFAVSNSLGIQLLPSIPSCYSLNSKVFTFQQSLFQNK